MIYVVVIVFLINSFIGIIGCFILFFYYIKVKSIVIFSGMFVKINGFVYLIKFLLVLSLSSVKIKNLMIKKVFRKLIFEIKFLLDILGGIFIR